MKTLVTIMALFLATAFSANAQAQKKTPKSTPQVSQASKQQPQADLSKQVQMQTDRMTRELELSPEQTQEIMSENKTLYSNMHSISSENVNSEDYENMSSRTMDNYDANLQDILDEGQYKKYQTMKSEYMKGFSTAKVSNTRKVDEKMEDE